MTRSPLVRWWLDLSVVDMVILFPMYNGIFALPVAAVLLFWAVNDRETMGEYTNCELLNSLPAVGSDVSFIALSALRNRKRNNLDRA